MTAWPRIFALPSNTGVLYAVACDDPKEMCFQNATNLMQEALHLQGEEDSNSIERKDGQLDEDAAWPIELLNVLRSIDEKAGAPWRLFSMASVKHGPHRGLQAVGIGSTQKKLLRASNLALAFTVAHSVPNVSQELKDLATAGIDRIADGSSCMLIARPEHESSIDCETTSPSKVHSQEISRTFEDWLGADSPLDCAKQRLVEFRRHQVQLYPETKRLLSCVLNGHPEMDSAMTDSIPTHVPADLRTILAEDTWGGASWGRDWILAWKKWQAPFIDGSNFHFGKESKRRANCRWYFGCDTPPSDAGPPMSSPALPWYSQKGGGGKSLDQSSTQPQQMPASSAMVEPAFEPATGLQQTLTSASPSCDVTSSNTWHPNPDVLEGLCNSDAYECLTIRTLTSADTIPLGTDLDPQHHNNLWAASQVKDPNAKLLVQYNLSCRVIDAENVGYSFGIEVRGKPKFYDVEGVRRAVAHFQSKGIDVVIVTKRDDTAQCLLGDGVQVVKAERTDDLVVLKQAQSRNCPIVSRDGFAKWRTDLRVSVELRRWLSESSSIQVRFSWGTGGEFVPDFDLPRPMVRSQMRQRL